MYMKVRIGQVRTGHVKPGQVRTYQVRTDQDYFFGPKIFEFDSGVRLTSSLCEVCSLKDSEVNIEDGFIKHKKLVFQC